MCTHTTSNIRKFSRERKNIFFLYKVAKSDFQSCLVFACLFNYLVVVILVM